MISGQNLVLMSSLFFIVFNIEKGMGAYHSCPRYDPTHCPYYGNAGSVPGSWSETCKNPKIICEWGQCVLSASCGNAKGGYDDAEFAPYADCNVKNVRGVLQCSDDSSFREKASSKPKPKK